MACPLFILEERRKPFKTRKVIDQLSNTEIKQHTGFSSIGAREIIDIFEPLGGLSNKAIPVETKVLCFLSHLRSGSFQWAIGSLGGVSQSSVSRIIKESIDLTIQLAPQTIQFPTTFAKINAVKVGFHSTASFPNIIGLIDGTQIRIKAPTNNESVYVCRKQYHSINTQVICGPDYSFFDIVAKWPGSTHDAFIYSNCGARQRIKDGEFGTGWLLGDSGYPLEERLLTPFSAERTEAQARFNRKHKVTRSKVERAIGIWKSRFRCIDQTGGSLCYDELKTCKIIVASAVLHNICINRNIQLIEEDELHQQQREERRRLALEHNIQRQQEPVLSAAAQRRQAVENRDRVANSFV